MSKPILFLTKELLKGARSASWVLLLWALTVTFALAAGTALLLLPAGGRAERPHTEATFLAALSPDIPDSQANELAWKLWSKPEIAWVGFRFPGEEGAPASYRALVVRLTSPEARSQVQALLSSLPEVVDVSYSERTVKPPPRLPLLARILALAGLAIAGATALLLGRVAVQRIAAAWGQAVLLLRASGVPESRLRIPFLVLGALTGLLGGAVYAGLLWGALSVLRGSQLVREFVPAFADCGPLATGIGLAAGLGLGVLGSLLGFPIRVRKPPEKSVV